MRPLGLCSPGLAVGSGFGWRAGGHCWGGAFGFIEQRASVKLSETGKQSLACSFDHPETAVPFEALKSILDTN
jgi:hypothetical protein